MKKKLSFLLFLMSVCTFANVSLPNIFSDNMVLQRNSEVKIWGWANTGEEVTLKTSWDNQEYKTKPNSQGYWSVNVKTLQAGGPFEISIKGYNQITFKNVLIGEVWLCSGQSNMEMSAAWGIKDGDEEVKKASYPNIRFFTATKLASTSPQMNLPGNWQECTPETMKQFSAVAYFFAQHLQEDLKNIPIGLINSSWGGTPAEIWMPEETIKNDKILLEAANKLTPIEWGPTEPGRAFNAMINPFVGYKIAGAIWYQGESNVGSQTYDATLAGLIGSWRKLWNYDFPFYFVQIAPFQYGGGDHYSGVIVRDSQRKTLQKVKNTGMVVVSDISPTDDIHPKDKKNVGIRLANLALANHYKTNKNIASGPLYAKIEIKKDKAVLQFDNAEGLYFKNKKSGLFEIAGADNVFYPAAAKITDNTIEVSSKKVKQPARVRYAWENAAQSDLFNKANLPASSFITE
jgi:sialate O-acetylesterase